MERNPIETMDYYSPCILAMKLKSLIRATRPRDYNYMEFQLHIVIQ